VNINLFITFVGRRNHVLKSGVFSLVSVFILFLTVIPWAWGEYSEAIKLGRHGGPETFAEFHGFVNFRA
jgi:hypothetical protein